MDKGSINGFTFSKTDDESLYFLKLLLFFCSDFHTLNQAKNNKGVIDRDETHIHSALGFDHNCPCRQ